MYKSNVYFRVTMGQQRNSSERSCRLHTGRSEVMQRSIRGQYWTNLIFTLKVLYNDELKYSSQRSCRLHITQPEVNPRSIRGQSEVNRKTIMGKSDVYFEVSM